MYEQKDQPLLSRRQFLRRAVTHFGLTVFLFALSLGGVVIGYRWIEGYTWLDSLLNAAIILSGMGLVDKPISDPGKVFASVYALFSGILFVAGAGIMLAPFAHRILHFFSPAAFRRLPVKEKWNGTPGIYLEVRSTAYLPAIEHSGLEQAH